MSVFKLSLISISFNLSFRSSIFGIKNLAFERIILNGFISLAIIFLFNRPASIIVVPLPLNGS